MKRSPLKADPAKVAAWQQRSRKPLVRAPIKAKVKSKRKKPLTANQRRKVPEARLYGRSLWGIKKADSEFSKWIRARDGQCVRCGSEKNLTCSHFWARQHKATRFDPENCVTLCWMPCHKYHWEKEKQGAYRDFMLNWLGEEKYKKLEAKSKTTYGQTEAVRDVMVFLEKITVKEQSGQ